MQTDEPSRVSPLHPESNPVIGISFDEIVVLAKRGGVTIGPRRGCSPSLAPSDCCPKKGPFTKVRLVEIPLIGRDGEISGVLCREIPYGEEVVRESPSEPLHAQAMDEIAKVFVHDINNVLSVIVGGLRLLERQGDSDARTVIFERMHRAVDRGKCLSRSLLDAGRSIRPERRAYACQADLLSALETLEHALGAKVCLRANISSALWEFSAEPEQLYLALLNLCRNADAAMSYVSYGGSVSISAVNVDPIPAAPQGAVVITVTDNGSGMSEEVLSRAFEPYYTTKANGEGTGLGLTQVPRFVEQYDGAIRVESELGSGTTVSMVFPRVFSEFSQNSGTLIGNPPADVDTRQLKIGYAPSSTGGKFFLADSGEGKA